MKVLIFALLLAIAGQMTNAKVFSKCKLARELKRLGVPQNELPDWVCLVQHESSFKTNAMNHRNKDKSKDWGIFQINDRYWCDPRDGRKTSNGCKLACLDLLTDDISKAVRCAQQIKREHKGFSAWVGWNKHCQKKKADLKNCF